MQDITQKPIRRGFDVVLNEILDEFDKLKKEKKL